MLPAGLKYFLYGRFTLEASRSADLNSLTREVTVDFGVSLFCLSRGYFGLSPVIRLASQLT